MSTCGGAKTAPEENTKTPTEVVVITMDFTSDLGTDTISSISSTAIAREDGSATGAGDAAIDSSSVSADLLKVLFTISAGVSGREYAVTGTIITVGGQTLVGRGILKVRDP